MNHNALPETPKPSAHAFANECGIDIPGDMGLNVHWFPRLAEFDSGGSIARHIAENGAEYDYSELQYRYNDQVEAMRKIAAIQPGHRTELAYWMRRAPEKELAIHKGRGFLVIGDPGTGATEAIALDAEAVSKVLLPPGRFYTIEAATDSGGPLIVSGFYEPPAADWDSLEKTIRPGSQTLELPGQEAIEVPAGFRGRYE